MTRRARSRRGDTAHAAAMAVVAAEITGYWADYFTRGRVRSSHDPAYIAFENAFPLADAYVVLSLLISAWQLRRGRMTAVPTGIAAGSGLVFLGAMDTLWNVEHGNYRNMTPEMLLETALNIGSLTFGTFTMIRLWRRRHALVSPTPLRGCP